MDAVEQTAERPPENTGMAPLPEDLGTPPEPSADDAMRAAEAHLREQTAAEQFPAPMPDPPTAQRYAQQPAPVMSYQVPALVPARSAREPARGQIRVIEELHARYPMAQGFRVRVWRREPRKDQYGNLAAGWLGDLTEPLGMSMFTACYGGGKYSLMVVGPNDPARGDISERFVAEMQMEIPGPPRMFVPQELAQAEDIMMQGQGQRYPYPVPVGMEPEKVAIAKIQAESEEKRRLEDRQREQATLEREYIRDQVAAAKPSDAAIEAISGHAKQTVEEMRRQQDEALQIMRERAQEQQIALREKDAELRQLREEILKARQEAVNAINSAETHNVQELRERNHTDLENLRESHRKELAELRQRYDDDTRKMQTDYTTRLDTEMRKYQTDLSAQTARGDKDRERIESLAHQERQSLREDFTQKEQNLRQSYEDRIRQQTDTFQQRIQDMERITQREIAAAKEQQSLAIQTIKEVHESRSHVEGTAANLRIQSLENEVANLKSRNEVLDRDCEKMRAEIHKPPAKALKEAEELSRMIGMVRKDEIEPVEAPAATGDMDWKQVAMGIGRAVVEKAPEFMQKLGEVRQTNASAAAAPVVATRQLPPGAPGGVPPMAPGAAGRRRRPGMPPNPGTSLPVPPAMGGPPSYMPPPQYVQPAVVPATAISSGPAAAPAVGEPSPMPPQPAPATAAYAPGAMEAQWDAAGRAAIAAQPAAQPGATGGPAPAQMDLQVQAFVEALERAITAGVDPGEFARGMIDQMGIANAVQAVGSVGPEKIVEMVSASPAAARSPIVTRAGEKYLHAVWEAARAQLRAAGAQI